MRPAVATAYTAGDEVSNHATAGSVVRTTFDLSGYQQGKILSAAVDVTPASGNLVITAFDLAVLLFKTPGAPAAVGDNTTHPIAGAVRRLALSTFRFDDGGWKNPLGAFSASTSGYQKVHPTQLNPLATPAEVEIQAPFSFHGSNLADRELTAVFQILGAWDPGNVANTLALTLDIEVE